MSSRDTDFEGMVERRKLAALQHKIDILRNENMERRQMIRMLESRVLKFVGFNRTTREPKSADGFSLHPVVLDLLKRRKQDNSPAIQAPENRELSDEQERGAIGYADASSPKVLSFQKPESEASVSELERSRDEMPDVGGSRPTQGLVESESGGHPPLCVTLHDRRKALARRFSMRVFRRLSRQSK